MPAVRVQLEGMKGYYRAQSTAWGLLPAALFLFFALPSRAQSVDSLPKPTDYVSDNAHVLSPDAIAQLDSICGQLDHSQANAQMAIVTVQTMNGEDAADYANQLEDKWKVGKKGTDKGVLVLLAVGDHKYRIDVGYGLEGILNDAKVGDIGREMVPYLRSNDYDSAVTMAVGQVGHHRRRRRGHADQRTGYDYRAGTPGTPRNRHRQGDHDHFPAHLFWRRIYLQDAAGLWAVLKPAGRGWPRLGRRRVRRRRLWRRGWRRADSAGLGAEDSGAVVQAEAGKAASAISLFYAD